MKQSHLIKTRADLSDKLNKMETTTMKKTEQRVVYDVIENILTRLPVKHLVRSRCVSKEWSKFLQNPLFANMHLIRSKEKKNEFKLLLADSGLCSMGYMRSGLPLNITQPPDIMKEITGSSWSEFVETKFGAFSLDCDFSYSGSKSNCQLKMVNCMAEIFGSCNGILCLIPDFQTIVLWNPTTKQRRIVPDNPYEILPLSKTSKCRSGYGFGYSALSMDYKVVSVTSIFEEQTNNHPSKVEQDKNNHPSVVSVYSLASNSWKKLSDTPYKISATEPGELIGGQLHWVAAHCSKKYACIIAFNLDDNKFKEVSIPKHDKKDLLMMNVAALNEKLGLIFTYKSHYQAWVMKEDGWSKSWAKLFKIEHRTRTPSLQPSFSTEDGTIVMVKDYSKIVLYNTKDESLRTLMSTDDRTAGFRAKTYVESFVSLDVRNEAAGGISDETMQQEENSEKKNRSPFASALSKTADSLHRARFQAYLNCFK